VNGVFDTSATRPCALIERPERPDPLLPNGPILKRRTSDRKNEAIFCDDTLNQIAKPTLRCRRHEDALNQTGRVDFNQMPVHECARKDGAVWAHRRNFRRYRSYLFLVLEAFSLVDTEIQVVRRIDVIHFVIDIFNLSDINVFPMRNRVGQPLRCRLDGYALIAFHVEPPHCGGLIVIHVPRIYKHYLNKELVRVPALFHYLVEFWIRS
jgi:hypothetical protein